jgi:sporulation protein YlmC with PRC-barrel domain
LQAGDGTLEYKTSNSKVVKVDATGKITITGTGRAVITVTCAPTKNYNEGSITTTITVKPKKPSVSLISKGNKMTVKWKKVSKVTGYKIQYANNKKFTKNCKNKTIQKNTFTIGGLKAKNTYYVRVCAYKTITVNGKKTTITGPWSKVKKITG